MKPKNSKERRNSVLKFGLLFLFTVALIVTAFFFDFDRVPFKENSVLRERSASVEKEIQFQKEFSDGMENVKSLIDSLDTPGQNLQYINAKISSTIVDLQKSIPKEDSTYRYDMYTNIVNSYVDIQAFKSKLKEYDGVDQRIEEYKEELDRLRQELNEANRYLDALRR
ncbi:type VI secretion system TssO [Aquimarina sp. 2201CG14-23]|uniref:type VI secretion system TssO n=1 Tax=Aquimarina mycalae TaxID=3040073 RepID=UPI002477DE7A|nr:type VI secretion system TssO [Aquimarina sp. 2201CG14-23]MDH7446795.1 type VI secretion system TssO [Aquimarina sp. 2201CG14-23]